MGSARERISLWRLNAAFLTAVVLRYALREEGIRKLQSLVS